MDETDLLKVAWVVIAVVLAVGEIVAPGLVLLPFAIGAAIATVFAFLEVAFGWQLLIFLVTSGIAFVALRPLARRLNDITSSEPIGAGRLLNQAAMVIEQIDDDHDGMVRIDREEWRAASHDRAVHAVGDHVRVVQVRGTRVIVTSALTEEPPP